MAAKWITASGAAMEGSEKSVKEKAEERALKTWPESVRSVFRVVNVCGRDGDVGYGVRSRFRISWPLEVR